MGWNFREEVIRKFFCDSKFRGNSCKSGYETRGKADDIMMSPRVMERFSIES